MENILSIIIGVVFVVIGALNRKGNISMLHSYHRKRVTEEDKIPMGKMIGNGMFVIAGTLFLYAGLSFLSTLIQNNVLFVVASVVLVVGMVAGSGFMLFAINKYNKGLF